MFEVGDLVEVGFEGKEGKIIGEIISAKNSLYEVYVMRTSEELSNYKYKQIVIHAHPSLQKNEIRKVELKEDTYFTKQKNLLLIDIALDTKDEQWFEILTNELRKMNESENSQVL